MPQCPVCRVKFGDWSGVAEHLSYMARTSDGAHVMWLNRNISNSELRLEELEVRLRELFNHGGDLGMWIRRRVIDRFYGENPHPFILAMQRPNRAILLGYVIEHQHFLRNWVRVLSLVVAKTDKDDVVRYELENIATEFLGWNGKPSHYELLLRMGESLGMPRERILATPPLKGTLKAISTWRSLAEERSWVEAMAAMHSLELLADRSMRRYGARMHYFNESILTSSEFPEAVREFLREGYEADVHHGADALALVEKYSSELGVTEDVQVTVLKSLDTLDVYLSSRLERAIMIDPDAVKVVGA